MCDNCNNENNEYLIKWPGLDASIQYQWVCQSCNNIFIKIKSCKTKTGKVELINSFLNRGKNANINTK